MPRPNSISEIHELKYELRLRNLKPEEFAEMQQRYERSVDRACEEFRCTKDALLKAISGDFGKWVRDEKLPSLRSDDRRF
jgi:hypothetical protein